jgi:hypothetical protein
LHHNNHNSQKLNAEDLEIRVWGFVVIAVTLILCFIVVALLYSVTFVTQPIKSMAPIDMAYTKMLNDIVLLIVGGIGGVIGKKSVGAAVGMMSSQPQQVQSYQPSVNPYAPPPTVASAASALSQGYNWMGFKNPDLDESWTPPPPPTTPPDLLESDEDREALALARKEVT